MCRSERKQWRVVCVMDVWADSEADAFAAARVEMKRLADGPLVLTLTPVGWPDGWMKPRARVLDSDGEAARKPR